MGLDLLLRLNAENLGMSLSHVEPIAWLVGPATAMLVAVHGLVRQVRPPILHLRDLRVGIVGWVQSSFEPFFFRFRSSRTTRVSGRDR